MSSMFTISKVEDEEAMANSPLRSTSNMEDGGDAPEQDQVTQMETNEDPVSGPSQPQSNEETGPQNPKMPKLVQEQDPASSDVFKARLAGPWPRTLRSQPVLGLDPASGPSQPWSGVEPWPQNPEERDLFRIPFPVSGPSQPQQSGSQSWSPNPRKRQLDQQQDAANAPQEVPAVVVNDRPITSEEQRKLIQQQLLLFLHARGCLQREAEHPWWHCELAHCGTMKAVLRHMPDCRDGRACLVPHCSSSHQIIGHWASCTQDDCQVCRPLRAPQRHRQETNPDAVAPVIDQAIPDLPAAAVAQPNGQESLSAGLPTGFASMDWPLGSEFRKHIQNKILQAIYPSPPPDALLQDRRMHNLVRYAETVEGRIFEEANSMSEYLRAIAEKIYKIQKELGEKCQQRIREQQLREQRQPLAPIVGANRLHGQRRQPPGA